METNNMDGYLDQAADFLNQLEVSLQGLVTNQNHTEICIKSGCDPQIYGIIENYNKLVSDFKELNRFVDDLIKGNYATIEPPGRHNYLAFRLKELHSMLSYTMWQAGLIANGDYRGGISYEGDFARMFNSMIQKLEERENMLKNEIGQRSIAENEALEKHNLLLSVLEGIRTIVVVVDTGEQQILYSNKMAREQFLIDGTELMKEFWEQPSDFQENESKELSLLGRWYSVKRNRIHWKTGQKADILLIDDITENKIEHQELLAKACYDLLTGVYNRTEGIRLLSEKLQNSMDVCVVFIDMDGLKGINDTYGHSEGDKALKSLTKLIQKCIREGDILCRLGGDEFMLIFEKCQREYAEKVMKRVEEYARKVNSTSRKKYNISFSYGISYVPEEGDVTPLDLMNLADKMMYVNKNKKKAKLAGSNIVRLVEE